MTKVEDDLSHLKSEFQEQVLDQMWFDLFKKPSLEVIQLHLNISRK